MTNDITHLVQFKGKTIGNFCASTLEPTAFPLQIVWIWDERCLPDRAKCTTPILPGPQLQPQFGRSRSHIMRGPVLLGRELEPDAFTATEPYVNILYTQ